MIWIIARSSDLQYNGDMLPQDMHRDEWLNDGEEQMQAEDAVWEATYVLHKDKFLTLREAARAEIKTSATDAEDRALVQAVGDRLAKGPIAAKALRWQDVADEWQ